MTSVRDPPTGHKGSTGVSTIDDNRIVRAIIETRRGCGCGLIVLLALATAGCGGSDEDRIAGRLAELVDTLSIESLETPMIREARAQRLGTFVTPDVSVDLGPPLSPALGQNEVVQLATGVRVSPGGVVVELDGVRVTVDEPTRRALATLTVRVLAGPQVGGELLETRAFEVVLAEMRGEWLVESAQFVDAR